MEQYLIKRKRNGQFSDKGRVIKHVEIVNRLYEYIDYINDIRDEYKKHLYIRNFIIVVLVTIIIYLLVK